MRPTRHTPMSAAHFFAQNTKWILLLIVCLLFLFWPRDQQHNNEEGAVPHHCPVFGKRYGIMMDAGSTGSRTHIFEFVFHADGTISLEREQFEQLKPGLSSFKGDPEGAAKSIVPLMEAAKKTVPKELTTCTPMALKATAGLRLIGKEESDKILAAVDKTMRSYKFAPASELAVVMDGRDEGPYAWITVNFLLGLLGAGRQHSTAAILDMGGASTQIVFEPETAAVLERAPADHVYSAKILGSQHRMYQHSYLGLGLKEAVNTVFRAAVRDPVLATRFHCLPKGYKDDKTGITNTESDIQQFDACQKFVSKTLFQVDAPCSYEHCAFNGIYQPPLRKSFKGPIYAFSYFYDRMEAFLPADGLVSVKQFKEVGKDICGSVGQKAALNLGTMCIDFAYLYTILTTGYGLEDEDHLHIKKKINGVETAWALGAMIALMQ